MTRTCMTSRANCPILQSLCVVSSLLKKVGFAVTHARHFCLFAMLPSLVRREEREGWGGDGVCIYIYGESMNKVFYCMCCSFARSRPLLLHSSDATCPLASPPRF